MTQLVIQLILHVVCPAVDLHEISMSVTQLGLEVSSLDFKAVVYPISFRSVFSFQGQKDASPFIRSFGIPLTVIEADHRITEENQTSFLHPVFYIIILTILPILPPYARTRDTSSPLRISSLLTRSLFYSQGLKT